MSPGRVNLCCGGLTILTLCAAIAAEAWAAGPATAPTPPRPQIPVPQGTLPFKDWTLSFKDRVEDLVGRLSLEEKAEQVQMYAPALKNAKGADIPAVNWWSESIHGIGRAGRATQFPQAIGMAAAWDPSLMHGIGDAIADEARVKYNAASMAGDARGEAGRYTGLMMWAPTINMARDPRWGRTQETYGEDPYLTSRLAVEYVKGLQGDDPKYVKTIATPKHFAMHSQETNRYRISPEASDRVLREYYLKAFQACFQEGHALSVMTAHSGINGVPDTANRWLLTDVLRTDWGFDGAVVTDWNAVTYLATGHNMVNTPDQAVAVAIKAGVDVLCNQQPALPPYVVAAVNNGLLLPKELDQALSRNLMLRFKLGMFDPPDMVPFKKPNAPNVVGSEEHEALALQAAREGIVLLQNEAVAPGYGVEKILPIDVRKLHSIAMIGPYADVLQLGNYPGDPARPQTAYTPLDGLREAVGDRVRVETSPWNPSNFAACVKVAQSCDVAVVVMGLTTSDRMGRDNTAQVEQEGSDRMALGLPVVQMQLLQAVLKANPLTVVVLEGGGVIGDGIITNGRVDDVKCMSWIKEKIPAAVMAWYPGERGGTALAEILLGKVNPSGRLPMTFYRSGDDLPALERYEISEGRTYMYFNKTPNFVFGHGLSYTTFEYKNLKVERAGATATVTLDVANTGGHAGEEVVQVYVHKPDSVLSRPIKQLAAFARVNVGADKTEPVKLSVRLSDLAYWDVKTKAFVVEPGKYEIMVGASSADIRLRGELEIK